MAKPKSDKDYVALAAKKITRPSKRARLPKLLIYSRNKKGKTKFGLSAPDVLTLDPEFGTDPFKNLDPPVWHIQQWTDIDEAYKFLRTGQHEYKWVNVDGLSKLHNMSLNYVRRQAEQRDLDRRPGQTTQRDYGNAGELMKTMLANFQALDMGVIYTAQERLLKVDEDDGEGEEEMTYRVADLPQGVRGIANSLVDVIGRLYVVKVKLKGGKEKDQRRLWIGPHPNLDTGYRSDFELPPFIKNPTVDKLVNLLHTGKEK